MQTSAVFLDLDTVDRGDLDLSTLRAVQPAWDLLRAISAAEVVERVARAGVAVTNKVVLNRRALTQAKGLKLICIAATGTNNVDLDAARELGIGVTNVTGYATPAVVQHVFSLILALTTQLPGYQKLVREGQWQQSAKFCLLDLPIRELSGKTLGIVGCGELGRAVAEVGKAFGMHVAVAQRPGGNDARSDRIPLQRLLKSVDVLSLHCPLADNTRNLIGADELALMRSDALLINTARGGIVNEQALTQALLSEQIGGAGIDVLSMEPPTEGNPLLALDLPNLIVTPHIAWASRESRQRLVDEVAANIKAFVDGKMRNRVV